MQTFYKKPEEQECISVGCVPSASVAVEGGAFSLGVVCGGGCVCQGVTAWGCLPTGVCPVRVSVQWGCLPRGCLARGVSARGCVPHPPCENRIKDACEKITLL